MANATTACINVLIAKEISTRGYVVTGVDNTGLAGVNPDNQPFNVTWEEAASLLLQLRRNPTYTDYGD